jgi:hypothetical protein
MSDGETKFFRSMGKRRKSPNWSSSSKRNAEARGPLQVEGNLDLWIVLKLWDATIHEPDCPLSSHFDKARHGADRIIESSTVRWGTRCRGGAMQRKSCITYSMPYRSRNTQLSHRGTSRSPILFVDDSLWIIGLPSQASQYSHQHKFGASQPHAWTLGLPILQPARPALSKASSLRTDGASDAGCSLEELPLANPGSAWGKATWSEKALSISVINEG